MRMIYPIIDMEATGNNIRHLRIEKGVSVKELSQFLGLSDVRAVYKWQRGETLPSIDNLLALSILLEVPIDQILIYK
jgi:transcriptional regulator with XRE-family HTH domain